MKYTSFQILADRYTKTIAGTTGTVTFSGTTAYTNSKLVNLPALKAGTILTPHEYKLLSGYLDHELGHVRYSDFKVLNDHHKQNPAGDPVLRYIHGVFEDVWMEQKVIERFPGSRKYLDYLCETIDAKAGQVQVTDLSRIYRDAWSHRGITVKGISGDLKPTISNLITQLPACKCSADCLTLAKKVRKELDQEDNNQQQQSQSQQQQDPNGAKDDTDNNTGATDSDPTNSSSDSPQTEGTTTSKSHQKDNQDQEDDHISEQGKDSTQDLISTAQKLESLKANFIGDLVSILNQSEETAPGGGQWPQGTTSLLPASTAYDKIFVPSAENLPQFQADRASISGDITSLKKLLSIYLMSRQKKAWSRGLEEGTLDQQNLHKLPAGEKTVFKIVRERRMINTAIQLLLDCSGSMNETLVRQSAIMLAEALAGVPKLKLSIAGFTTGRYIPGFSRGTGRTEALELLLYKDFDTPYPKSQPRLGAIQIKNSTPLGDAYGKALERILPRPEERKIIWIVTDGNPGTLVGDTRHSDFPLMATIHKKCQRLRIETLGIEIGNISSLRNYVDKTVHINTISELARNLMSQFKTLV